MSLAPEFIKEWDEAALKAVAEQTLRRLHIGGTLKGFWYLVYAVAETVKDPMRTDLITKDLYRETAKKFRVEYRQVERAIRTAINACWTNGGRPELDQMLGYHLEERPANGRFVDIVAAYIRQTYEYRASSCTVE